MHLCVFQIYDIKDIMLLVSFQMMFRWLCANHCVIVFFSLKWMQIKNLNQLMQHQTTFLSHRNTSVHFLTSFQISISLSIPLASFPPYRFPLNLERGQSSSRGRKRHKHGLEVRFPLLTGQLNPLWLMFISPHGCIGIADLFLFFESNPWLTRGKRRLRIGCLYLVT